MGSISIIEKFSYIFTKSFRPTNVVMCDGLTNERRSYKLWYKITRIFPLVSCCNLFDSRIHTSLSGKLFCYQARCVLSMRRYLLDWLRPPWEAPCSMQPARLLQRRAADFTLLLCLHAFNVNMNSDDDVSCAGIVTEHLLEEDGL